MSNYWPVIMWMSDVRNTREDTFFIYVPSWSHYRHNQSGPYRTWRSAMRYALKHMQLTQHPSMDRAIVPGFWPIVLEQDERPDTSDARTFKMIVRRIPLGDYSDE